MKRITLLILLAVTYLGANAGFVLGYQVGSYIPKISNTAATMYYYNKVYDANFRYVNAFHGLFVGFRGDDKKSWISFAWNRKQNTFSSEYLDASSERYKLAIRTRMSELVLDGGIKNKKWGFGMGINLANFDVVAKRAKINDFGDAKWAHEYGSPVKLFGLPDNPSFSFIVEKKLENNIFFRTTYHFGVAPLNFSTGGFDWLFKVNNLTFTFIIKFKKQ